MTPSYKPSFYYPHPIVHRLSTVSPPFQHLVEEKPAESTEPAGFMAANTAGETMPNVIEDFAAKPATQEVRLLHDGQRHHVKEMFRTQQ